MAEKSDSSNQSQGEQNQKELDQICNELGEKQKGVDAKFADLDDKMGRTFELFQTHLKAYN
jgi:protein involved in temperature-dependent protein secretion